MTIKKVLFFLCFIPTFVFAQSADNSPYSRFGFGDLINSQKVASNGMGSLKSVFGDQYNTNFDNPATLTSLLNATYEGGVYAKYSDLTSGSASQTQWSGNISYLSIAFPLKNQLTEALQKTPSKLKWVMGFNLAPYTTINYSLNDKKTVDSIGVVESLYSGTGGTYKMVMANAVKYKNFSAGLNIGWMFGKSSYTRQISFNDLPVSYSDLFTDEYSVSGFAWKAGLSYKFDMSKSANGKEVIHPSRNLLIGVSGNGVQNFSTNQSYVYTRLNPTLQGTGSNTIDTFKISPLNGINGKGTLPAEINIGLMYTHSPKLKLGLDYNYSDWSSYKNDAKSDAGTVIFGAQSKIAVGVEYSPSPEDYKYYFKRIRYRLGAYYSNDPRKINNIALEDKGISIGLGMPIRLPRQQIAFVHWALELGQMGNTLSISEKYLRLHFAFTFSDTSWFYKRKYD